MIPFLGLPVGALAELLDARLTLDTDANNTGKRKVDGSRSDTRIGEATTERWTNERFRQVMLLILEFRNEWPNQSLLTYDDVQGIKAALDDALFYATLNGHSADMYDLNPTAWAIYLVQRAHSLKAGGWTVESIAAQQRLTFASLYNFLSNQHARHNKGDFQVRDPMTQRLHRYTFPFKPMRLPPAHENMFKYRKGAARLNEWITGGGQAVGLAEGIIAMEPPAIVAAPPGVAQRNARAGAVWERVRSAAAQRSSQRNSRLRSVEGGSVDDENTRQVVNAIIQAAQGAPGDGGGNGGGGGGGNGAESSQIPLEDVRFALMADSGEAAPPDASGGAGSSQAHQSQAPGGSEGSGSGGRGGGGDQQMSEYERERLENIRRNNEVLRGLGLAPDPLPRQPPAPRQPRPPPRVDGPRRESSRLQGMLRPTYNDEDPTLATRFDSDTRARIKHALVSAVDLERADLELAHFMSATQRPREKITTSGISGDAEQLEEQPDSVHVLLSLKIRDFLGRAGLRSYSPSLLWKWIALLPGLDVTALLYRGEVIGAALGFYSAADHAYLTHVTAAHRSLQDGVGVGLFLRRMQLRRLEQRLDPGRPPLEVVSLSAVLDHERGPVQFQRHVFTQKLGFEEVDGALPIIQRIAEANPGLELESIMSQEVTPLRFRKR